jgi:hypothetical protein
MYASYAPVPGIQNQQMQQQQMYSTGPGPYQSMQQPMPQPTQQNQNQQLPLLPAMSGLHQDAGAYQADLRQSVGPGQYVLASFAAPHCRPCLAGDSRMTVGTSGVAACAMGSLVDVESELQNLTRPATLSPAGHYRGDGGPPTTCPGAGPLSVVPDCMGIPAVDTRLADPPCTLRGTGWNRFEWLCRDPQRNAITPFGAPVDTGLVVKDNHRPHLARPLDPSASLPPGAAQADPSVGAPEWQPDCAGQQVGAVGETPFLTWRHC